MNIEEARQIAQYETTTPAILAELANSKDYQTRRNVAANPNTSTEILLSIYFEFPSEVINNPVIPLLLLENPYILSCKLDTIYEFNAIKNLTDIEIKRLGWTIEQGRNYLIKNYGKRTRLKLTDREICDFLFRLKSLQPD